MYKNRIELVTYSDIMEFVNIASSIDGDVKLTDGKNFAVNGKSLLGTVATVEWNQLFCVSDKDIYNQISKFCVDEPVRA